MDAYKHFVFCTGGNLSGSTSGKDYPMQLFPLHIKCVVGSNIKLKQEVPRRPNGSRVTLAPNSPFNVKLLPFVVPATALEPLKLHMGTWKEGRNKEGRLLKSSNDCTRNDVTVTAAMTKEHGVSATVTLTFATDAASKLKVCQEVMAELKCRCETILSDQRTREAFVKALEACLGYLKRQANPMTAELAESLAQRTIPIIRMTLFQLKMIIDDNDANVGLGFDCQGCLYSDADLSIYVGKLLAGGDGTGNVTYHSAGIHDLSVFVRALAGQQEEEEQLEGPSEGEGILAVVMNSVAPFAEYVLAPIVAMFPFGLSAILLVRGMYKIASTLSAQEEDLKKLLDAVASYVPLLVKAQVKEGELVPFAVALEKELFNAYESLRLCHTHNSITAKLRYDSQWLQSVIALIQTAASQLAHAKIIISDLPSVAEMKTVAEENQAEVRTLIDMLDQRICEVYEAQSSSFAAVQTAQQKTQCILGTIEDKVRALHEDLKAIEAKQEPANDLSLLVDGVEVTIGGNTTSAKEEICRVVAANTDFVAAKLDTHTETILEQSRQNVLFQQHLVEKVEGNSAQLEKLWQLFQSLCTASTQPSSVRDESMHPPNALPMLLPLQQHNRRPSLQELLSGKKAVVWMPAFRFGSQDGLGCLECSQDVLLSSEQRIMSAVRRFVRNCSEISRAPCTAECPALPTRDGKPVVAVVGVDLRYCWGKQRIGTDDLCAFLESIPGPLHYFNATVYNPRRDSISDKTLRTLLPKAGEWLRELYLRGSASVRAETLSSIPKHCPNITHLDLSLCSDLEKSPEALNEIVTSLGATLVHLALEQLHVGGIFVSDGGVMLPCLESLVLNESPDCSATLLKQVTRQCPKLQLLHVNYCPVSVSEVADVLINCNQQITSLDIGWLGCLNENTATLLAPYLKSLTYLSMEGTKCATPGALHTLLRGLASLRYLNVSYVKIVMPRCPVVALTVTGDFVAALSHSALEGMEICGVSKYTLVFDRANVRICDTKTQWAAAIADRINCLKARTASTKEPQKDYPVVVVWETTKALTDFLACEGASFQLCGILTPQTKPADIQKIVDKATLEGRVTMMTREFGRELAFSCRRCSMLAVIQTFFTSSWSEEAQIRGCNGRQGEGGNFHLIATTDDVIRELTPEGADSKRLDELSWKLVDEVFENFRTREERLGLLMNPILSGFDGKRVLSYVLLVDVSEAMSMRRIPGFASSFVGAIGDLYGMKWNPMQLSLLIDKLDDILVQMRNTLPVATKVSMLRFNNTSQKFYCCSLSDADTAGLMTAPVGTIMTHNAIRQAVSTATKISESNPYVSYSHNVVMMIRGEDMSTEADLDREVKALVRQGIASFRVVKVGPGSATPAGLVAALTREGINVSVSEAIDLEHENVFEIDSPKQVA